MVGIAPRRATAGRVQPPATAAVVPRAEAGIPSAEVVEAIPVGAGSLVVEATDKFETFERVEVSCKLLYTK